MGEYNCHQQEDRSQWRCRSAIRAIAVTACLLLLCFSLPMVTAAEPGDLSGAQPACDGYLLSLKQDEMELTSLLPQALCTEYFAKLSQGSDLYLTSSLELIEQWIPAQYLDFVEPNYFVNILEDLPAATEPTWNLEMIHPGHSRDLGLTGSGVRLAVIDSGLNPAHQDLDYRKIETGWNYMDNSNNTTDTCGHGTFVSGLICAVNQNGLGYDGIAPDVTLIPLKVTDEQNTSTIALTVQAIYGAVDDFYCDVLNLSLGMTMTIPSTALQTAIDYAVNREVVIVAAAGNDGSSDYFYPASCDGVVSVGSVDKTKQVSYFSQKNDALDLVAPGEGLDGLWSGGAGAYRTNGSGTSFAAPQVAALAALAKQADPNLTPGEFSDILSKGTQDLGAAGYDTSYGSGLLDLEKTLLQLFGVTVFGTAETMDSGIEFKAEIYNLYDVGTLQLVLASYLPSGRMADFTAQTATPDAAGSLCIDRILPAVGAGCVKLFLLQDWNALKPLHNVEIFPVADPAVTTAFN
ncbi:MAG: S8 family serine peptidase [Negativicutes bacterium]|nr:S8 family serine peptidase [Negativicutes bacterium]